MEELNRTEREARASLKHVQRYICFIFWCIQCIHLNQECAGV